MLKIFPIVVIFAAFGITSSKGADVLQLRLTVPRTTGSAMLAGAQSIDAGFTAQLSTFAKVRKITVSEDPLKDLYENKTDIAVVSTASLSSAGADAFAIFDLPFLFSESNGITTARLQNTIGDTILSSLHKQGLVGLGFWNEGTSQLFGAPLHNFDDLRGKKVCVIGSPTAGFTTDANNWAAELKTKSNRLSSQKASNVLATLGATPVNFVESPTVDTQPNPVDAPQNANSWHTTCQYSDVVEATPMSIEKAAMDSYLDFVPKSISSRGFRPLVYAVVVREPTWDAMTTRIQQGLIEQVIIAAVEVNKNAIAQENSALISLSKKGFILTNTYDNNKDKNLALAKKAWRGAAGDDNSDILDLILSVQAQQPATAPAQSSEPATAPPPQSLPQTSGPEKHGEIPLKDFDGDTKVLFATDRRDDVGRDSDPRFRFANTPGGTMSYGVASINSDPDRKLTGGVGKTELSNIDTIGVEDFKRNILSALDKSNDKSVLIYVHGFWTEFREAVLSTKILSDDLNLGKVAVLYSWPSNAQLQLYSSDEDRVLAGRNDFVSFLKMIGGTVGAGNVSVFAHSMGARLTTFALDYMSANSLSPQPPIKQILLAAPDIDVETFNNELPAYKTLVQKRATIYASKFDKALACSGLFHGDRRVGQGGDNVFVSPDVDTIDASDVEQPATVWAKLFSVPCDGGHSYYIDNLSVQQDIHEWIGSGVQPAQRHGLVKVVGKEYWIFKSVN
jgi:esterase/lipase superfamily enzyme/TRAP-type C4-dicarboxylate transport system substrate-binding protein